ncbi:MAG: alpha/beta hydrolase [Acidobacteria bacterium]|nr:alpha/beta hydrolase [Acidobacteriota bacterium]
MSSAPPPSGLRYVEPSPLGALAIAHHRVPAPRATVIAIHGGLDRASSFTRVSRRLEEFDVIAYDRRGYQRSRELGPGTLAQHVADLRRVIEWAAHAGPVVLFGHSFGGLVAMTLAAEAPDAPDVVVAYESPLPWVLTRPSPTPVPGGDPALEAERFFRRVVSDSSWERLGALEQESRRLDGPALSADLRAMTSPSAPFDLRDIQVPVRYLYGDQRAAPYYHALAQRLAAASRFFTSRELQGAAHGAHLSHPDVLATEIRHAFEHLSA